MCDFLDGMTEEEFERELDKELEKTRLAMQIFDDYARLSVYSGLGIQSDDAFHYDYIVKFDTFDEYTNVSFYPENGSVPNRKGIIFYILGGIARVIENFISERNSKVVSFVAVNDRINKYLYTLSQATHTLSSNKWHFIKTTIIDDKMVYWFEKI